MYLYHLNPFLSSYESVDEEWIDHTLTYTQRQTVHVPRAYLVFDSFLFLSTLQQRR